MTNPVPGFRVTTPFGRRGQHWSCRRNAAGHGIHTGADWAAPSGTRIVAARGGRVQHVSFGAAFGTRQFVVVVGSTRDFYAHTLDRPANGATVTTGQRVARVGASGNATGPHLHFERHTSPSGGWSCDVVTDPQPSIDHSDTPPPPPPPPLRLGEPVLITETTAGTTTSWLVLPGDRPSRLNISANDARSWTGPRLTITDRATFERLVRATDLAQ